MTNTYMVEKGTASAIDVLGPGDKGIYSNKTAAELEADLRITIELVDSNALLARTRMQAKLPIKEVSSDRWWHAFECMPPHDYARTGGTESFFLMEAYTADVHYGYVKVGDRYFEFRDQLSMKHKNRVQLAMDFIADNPVTTLVTEAA